MNPDTDIELHLDDGYIIADYEAMYPPLEDADDE